MFTWSPRKRRRTHGSPSPEVRPHGHVLGVMPTDPMPESLDGHPHGHVVGHAPTDPTPESLDGLPHGHVVGHPNII
jgi:hypothetical protein